MITRLMLILVTILVAVPAPGEVLPSTTGDTGIISVPMANVRREPEPKSQIITQVLLADEVRILAKRDNRYHIAIQNQGNREGWIQQEAVQVPRDKGRSYLKTDRTWVVITAPKTPALILDKLGNQVISLYGGTRLPVIAQNAKGFTVQFPDHTAAIIQRADAIPVSSRETALADILPAEIAKTARQFQGVPYFSGGKTAQGMDTGGLIYIVYRIHGIDLDMGRSALEARFMKVAKKDLLPGDILLFAGEGSGLAIGNGQFLHAPRKARIEAAGIHDRRYANALQQGLRIIGSDLEEKRRPAEMSADEIMIAQDRVATLPIGKRIVYWAGRFVGTPYDTDPLGLYVRMNRIIADEKADCMYLTFRSVELARSITPGDAIEEAKRLRFITEGKVKAGLVQNYEERFEYGEDMAFSGKWGRNITEELGPTKTIVGSRGRDTITILPKTTLADQVVQKRLQDGDIIYWIKDPKKRTVDEIVAHLSFVHMQRGKARLIHAAGTKDSATRSGGGMVKEVALSDYLHETKFIGALITRFAE